MEPQEPTHSYAAVIYNPTAVDLDELRAAVAAQTAEAGWAPPQWFETSPDDLGRAAVREALTGSPAVVLVAGGDGTVRTVAEEIVDSGIPLALLPSGTGNLLARNLSLPLGDLERSVATAFSGTTRAIDIAVADLEDASGTRTRPVFLVMAGIGLDAEMAQHTSATAKRRLGWFAYVGPIVRSILANRRFHVRYRVDGGRTRASHAHTIIVGNCGTLTGDMLLMPDAVIDDGLLDVVMLRPRGRFEWARIGTRLTLQGIAHRSRVGRGLMERAPELRALAYAQGRRFDVRFDRPHEVELDGDAFGAIVAARITVRPGALRVRVDADPED